MEFLARRQRIRFRWTHREFSMGFVGGKRHRNRKTRRNWGEFETVRINNDSAAAELSLSLQEQNRNVDGVAHIVRNAAIEDVGNETMSMGCHGNEVHLVLCSYSDNLIRRLAI